MSKAKGRWWAMYDGIEWLIFPPSMTNKKIDDLGIQLGYWRHPSGFATYHAKTKHYKNKLLKMLNVEAQKKGKASR